MKDNQKWKNSNKKEKKNCSYCKKNGHEEHYCKDKQIDELLNIMRKNKIDVPNAYKDKGSSSTSKGKGQALVASAYNGEEWVLDLGETHHMGASREQFSSITPSHVPYIYVGNDTQVEVQGKGNVELENGIFTNVLHVPHLSTNLLSIYQITHYGCGNKVEFLI